MIYEFNGAMKDLMHCFKKVGPVNPPFIFSSTYLDDKIGPMVEIDCWDGFFFGDEVSAKRFCPVKEMGDLGELRIIQ